MYRGVLLFSLLVLGCSSTSNEIQPLALKERIDYVTTNGTDFLPFQKRAFLETRARTGIKRKHVIMMFGSPDSVINQDEWIYDKKPHRILIFKDDKVSQIKANIKKNKKKD